MKGASLIKEGRIEDHYLLDDRTKVDRPDQVDEDLGFSGTEEKVCDPGMKWVTSRDPVGRQQSLSCIGNTRRGPEGRRDKNSEPSFGVRKSYRNGDRGESKLFNQEGISKRREMVIKDSSQRLKI